MLLEKEIKGNGECRCFFTWKEEFNLRNYSDIHIATTTEKTNRLDSSN